MSVDADEKAVSWGRERLPAARFIAARAEDVLSSLPPPHAVVVNPPRGGLHWDVSLRLTSEPVAKLVYISCDPATLARDLSRMNVNYQLKAVRAFDLFPQDDEKNHKQNERDQQCHEIAPRTQEITPRSAKRKRLIVNMPDIASDVFDLLLVGPES